MAEPAPQSNLRRLALVAGLALVGAYALSAYLPPPRLKYVSPTPETWLMSRLFPGVEVGWIVWRLAALALGSALTVWASLPWRSAEARDIGAESVPTAAAGAALACALVHLAIFPFASALPPLGQGLYMLWLFAPAAIVALALGGWRPRLSPPWVGTLALIAGWYVARWVVTQDDPRIASAVDLWRTFNALVRFTGSDRNMITDSFDEDLPGVPATPLFFSGLPLLHLFERTPSLGWSQIAASTWLAITAAIAADLAARLTAVRFAPIAAAAVLASPYVLLMQMVPDISYIGPLLSALIVGAGMRVRASASPAAFLVLCPLLGISIRYPALIGVVAIFGIVGLRRIQESRQSLGLAVIAAGALSFFVIATPGLPSPSTVATMVDRFVRPGLESGILQEAVLHQKPLDHTKLAWGSAKIGRFDMPVAAALTPFAVPRTDMRLMGDALFEPLATALAAIGLGLCFFGWRTDPRLGVVGLLLIACLAPGALSNMDRTSFGRMFGAPLPMALLSAIGACAVLGRLPQRAQTIAAGGLSVAILAGGIVLFDVVNPRITRRSALGLTLESLAASDVPRAMLLLDRPEGKEDWTFSDLIADHLGEHRLAMVDIGDDPSVVELPPRLFDRGREILLWSRPVEGSTAMSRRVCQRWPDTTLFGIRDAPGFSLVFAAQISGNPWTPALPPAQWQAQRCSDLPEMQRPIPPLRQP